MKHLILSLTILIILMVSDVYSQITLETDRMPVVGDQLIQQICDTTGVLPGSSGANQTWDFSNINVSNDSIIQTYVDPSGTPFSIYFPSSQLTSAIPDFDYYVYNTITGGDLNIIGIGAGVIPDQVITTYTDPLIEFKLPMPYNSSYTDNYIGTISSPMGNYNRSGTITNTADAYGTIILPSRTFNNVLRVHSHRDVTDSLIGSPNPVVIRTIEDFYWWFSDQYKYHVFFIGLTDVTTADQTSDKLVAIIQSDSLTDIKLTSDQVVNEYELSQNHPNPFNPSTKIRFTISELRFTILKVYDVLGNEVATLVNEELPAGEYEVEFIGDGLTSGVYFYQLRAIDPESSLPVGQTGSGQGFVETKKMILMK